MSSYISWYREGSVSVTNGNNVVTGNRTYWTTAGIHPGDIFKVGGLDYEVGEVTSDTTLTVIPEIKSATSNKLEYAVIRNFTASMSTEIAAKAIDLLGKFTKYVDADMQTVQGKSAYEIAKENGFTGSIAQWLESLKAANEWSNLDERTNILTSNGNLCHNSIARGISLGARPTQEQMAAIRDGTFKGLWLGDSWNFGASKYRIVHFNYFCDLEDHNHSPLVNKPHVVVMITRGYFHDTQGTMMLQRWSDTSNVVPEGGYLASELAAAYSDEGAIMQQIIHDLGEENLLEFPIRTCNSFVDGECKSYTTKLVKACPPTEKQLFGERRYSIEQWDPFNSRTFALQNIAPNNCSGVWGMKPLREIAGTNAVCCNYYGINATCAPNSQGGNEIQFMCVLG